MIAETFKKQPKWRRWGTLIFLFLSILFILVSFSSSTGIFFDVQTELSPFLSLIVLMLIFGTMWVIIPSLFFALLGFLVERLTASSDKTD